MPGGNRTQNHQTVGSEPAGSGRGTAGPSLHSKLTPRAVAALGFIAVENANRRFPGVLAVQQFLGIRWDKSARRVVEKLVAEGLIRRTARGFECCEPKRPARQTPRRSIMQIRAQYYGANRAKRAELRVRARDVIMQRARP